MIVSELRYCAIRTKIFRIFTQLCPPCAYQRRISSPLTFRHTYEHNPGPMPNNLKNWQKHLCQAFGRHRLAHALLLACDDQESKEYAARFIAKLVLCGIPPCEACNDCNQVNAGQHLNVEWVLSATS